MTLELCDFGTWQVGAPMPAACALPAACAKPAFSLELSAKPTILASWRPRRPQTACRRASWCPRRPPDGPPGAQDGLPTDLLAPKTASARASWRPRRPPDGPPGTRDGLPTGLLTPLHGPPGVCMTTILTKRLSDQLNCRQLCSISTYFVD